MIDRGTDLPCEPGWVECPPGEVSRLVVALRRRRRRHQWQNVAVGTTFGSLLLLFAGLTVIQSERSSDNQRWGGMTCREVHEQFESYLAGTLDENMSHRIDAHLSVCQSCRHSLDELKQEHANLSGSGGVANHYSEPVLVTGIR